MNKKIIHRLGTIVFYLLAFYNIAYCAFEIKTVDNYGSYNIKTTFGWNETPYLYIKLPSSGSYTLLSFIGQGNLGFSSNDEQYVNFSYRYFKNPEVWFSIDEEFASMYWDDMSWKDGKKTGWWYVESEYSKINGSSSGNAYTSYNVTPEPVSSILFLIGGVALGARQYKKRKKMIPFSS
ncbi:hypothetical protein HZA55_01500 [Candidatus Poribacteria bacterium]|nr:hypothetical protein [Candidatus Poribacteria bacterium]